MAKFLRIVARREGFRRAGIAHPGHPVDHPIDRFTPEQIEQLRAEPMLVVVEVDESVKAGKPPRGDGKNDK